jgi:hypothetical protein
MKFHQVLSIVPKPVRTVASAIVVCAALMGPVIGFMERRADGRISTHGVHFPILASISGLAFGLLAGVVIGVVIAVWVLCLGYVYGDARRRLMPPILWTLIAALVPNLLGFLLYFALRRPTVFPCTHCGQAITAEQRFCSWCGHQGPSTSSGTPVSRADHSGADTTATA